MREQRKLVRTLGLGYIIIFVVANIIGSGVYKKIAPMAAELPRRSGFCWPGLPEASSPSWEP